MILLSLFWRTSLFVASLYYSFSIHLVFNALSLFCRSPNCHISPQLPPLPLAHPPSLHKLPNSPVPLLHPVPTVDYSSSLRSILFLQYGCFVVFIGNSSSLILFLSRPFGHFFLVNTVQSVANTNLCTSPFVKSLLLYALIQPTLRWFSPFHQLSPTHFFLCSCTIWLIKVIPTPSFYTSSLPPIASHYQPIRNFLTFKIPLIPYPFNFSSLPFQPPITSPFNFTVLSCSASFFHLFCPIINYRVFIPHPSHFANLLLFI